eukprot:s631_g44.t1
MALRGDTRHSLRFYRCPNAGACPGGDMVLAANLTQRCAQGYDDSSAGCSQCASGYGRQNLDPFECVRCGRWDLSVVYFLLLPVVPLLLAVRSASQTEKERMSMVIKVILSFGTFLATIQNILEQTTTYRELRKQLTVAVGLLEAESEAGGATLLSASFDCLMGGHASRILASSREIYGLVTREGSFGASWVRRTLVLGNAFLPAIFASFLQWAPCFHMAKEPDGSFESFSVFQAFNRWDEMLCSGAVAYHSENKLAILQFRSGPCLRIGQAVTFSIVDGAAVDILAADPSKEAVSKHVERTDDVARPAASQAGAWRQSTGDKRLQREIGRFRNATGEEQLEWMDRSEMELQQLLEDGGEDGNGLDGDRLCCLIRRLAAWLHRPVLRSAAEDLRLSGQKEGAGPDFSQLQRRIRRALITALENIDLEDDNTRRCLESALAFIQELCDQADFPAFAATSSSQQWHQLRLLICRSDGEKVGQHDKKTSVANRLPAVDNGGVSNGVFYPNKKVKSLPTVFEGQDVIQLQCSSCPATISSSWFFRHPGNEQISVLVPQHGHHACGKKLGKLSPWIPASDVPAKRDKVTEPCGGFGMPWMPLLGLSLFLLLGPLHWAFMVSQSRKWKNRKEYIGFLIAGYNSHCEWWEITVLLRKTFLIGALVLLPVSYAPMSLVIATVLIMLAALVGQHALAGDVEEAVGHLAMRPYVDPLMNLLEGAVLTYSMLALILTLYLMSESWTNTNKTLVFFTLIGSNAVTCLLLLVVFLVIALRRPRQEMGRVRVRSTESSFVCAGGVATTASFPLMAIRQRTVWSLSQLHSKDEGTAR